MEYSQPVITVERFAECVHFYLELLGMELIDGSADGPIVAFQSGGSRLTLLDKKSVPTEAAEILGGQSGAARVTLVFNSNDIDADFQRLSGAGVIYKIEPHDFKEWDVRSSVCLDPDGNPVEIVSSNSLGS